MATRKQREEESKKIVEPFVEDWLKRAGTHFAAFRNWAVGQVLWDVGLSDEQIEEATAVDGPGDMGIDAWYVSEEDPSAILYLVQAKDTRATEDDLDKMKKGFLRLFDPKRNVAANLEVRTRAADLRDKLDDELSIEMHLVTSKLLPANFLTRAIRDKDSLHSTDEINIDGHKMKVSLYVHDVEVLASNIRLIRDEPIAAEFSVGKGEYFEYETGSKYLTVSAAIRADQLAKLFNKHRLNLFRLNPRYYLSRKSKTNKEIEKTLNDSDPANFYLYNNGLTATGSGVKVSNKRNSALLAVDDFQIVNGCQTTVTIFEVWRRGVGTKHFKDVRVPIRIIETQNAKQMAERVATTTNSQNKMNPEDFRSGDPLHRRLQEEFRRLTPSWYYEHKRGTWNTEIRTAQEKRQYIEGSHAPRRIQMKDLAQACLAFLGEPDKAAGGIGTYFSSDEGYRQLFPEESQASQLLLPNLLFLNADLVAKKFSYEHEEYEWSTRYLRYPMVACLAKLIRYLMSDPRPGGYFPTELAEQFIESSEEWAPVVLADVIESMANYVQRQASSGIGVRSLVRRRPWIDEVFKDVRYKVDIRLKTEADVAFSQGGNPNHFGLRRKFPVPIVVDE